MPQARGAASERETVNQWLQTQHKTGVKLCRLQTCLQLGEQVEAGMGTGSIASSETLNVRVMRQDPARETRWSTARSPRPEVRDWSVQHETRLCMTCSH